MGNEVTIIGVALDAGTPSDPSLCRVSGTLRNIHGQYLVGWYLTVRHFYNPLSVDTDTLVLREASKLCTNGEGFIQFDLYRDSEVQIELSNQLGFEHFHVYVPDQAEIDLIDLLIPRIVEVAFTNDDPIEVSVDEVFQVETEATLSDGRVISLGTAAVLTSSDEDIVAKVESYTFRADGVGSTTISVDSVDESLIDNFNKDTRGSDLVKFDVPAATLPSPITVNVS